MTLLKPGRVLLLLAVAALLCGPAACRNGEKTVEEAVRSAAEAAGGESPERAAATPGGEPVDAPDNAPVNATGIATGIVPDASGPGDLLYEEEPFPGFSDHIGQVDYALARAVQLGGLPAANLQASQGPLEEHRGHLYHPQILIVHGVADVPAFAQALRDSLLAWAERAALLRAEKSFPAPVPPGRGGAAFQVLLDGAITHYIYLSPRPDSASERPRLVVVIDDLGESKRQAERLLALNFPVTFAVWPHSTHAAAVASAGHAAGAEVIVHQPMQPLGYPSVNPGAGVLLEGMSEAEILAALSDNFARVPWASGLNNHMGSRLTQDEAAMRVVSGWLAGRGLLALDSLTHAKSRFAKAASDAGARTYKRDVFLDVEADKEKILAQLRKAEHLALVKGQAVAIGHPLAATLAALEEWQHGRDPQIALVRLEDLTPIAPAVK